MDEFNIIEPVTTEIFRLDSLLKVMRIAAFEQAERPKDALPTEDFPYLFDIALDRLDFIKNHVDEIETTVKGLLKGEYLEKQQTCHGSKHSASK